MELGSSKLLLVGTMVLAVSSVSPAQGPRLQAWRILTTGVAQKSANARAIAVGALGLIVQDAGAAVLAEKALEDQNSGVRAAGARALGQMLYAGSIPALRKALTDQQEVVVGEAAQSLVQLKDPAGYELYYSVLTGERKRQGLVSQEMNVLTDDPAKVAVFSLEEGIGFVPFAGYGLSIYYLIKAKDAGIRLTKVVAAGFLAADPNPQSGEALVQALSDKSWLVRKAALEALARRGNAAVLPSVEAAMEDKNDHVRYAAAAAVIRLTNVQTSKESENLKGSEK